MRNRSKENINKHYQLPTFLHRHIRPTGLYTMHEKSFPKKNSLTRLQANTPSIKIAMHICTDLTSAGRQTTFHLFPLKPFRFPRKTFSHPTTLKPPCQYTPTKTHHLPPKPIPHLPPISYLIPSPFIHNLQYKRIRPMFPPCLIWFPPLRRCRGICLRDHVKKW